MSLLLTEEEIFLDFTATELSIPSNSISLASNFRDIPSWSSLNALVYISRINEETDVLITSGDLSGLTTLNDIYNLITTRANGVN